MLSFDKLMTLVIELGEVTSLGRFPQGERRLARVAGGHFEGPAMCGRVLAGGCDWQWLRGDGTLEIDAQYVLAVDDGARVQVRNQGLRHGPPEVLVELAAGRAVDSSRYSYRSVLRFATADTAHDALNRTLGVAAAERRGAHAVFDVYRLC